MIPKEYLLQEYYKNKRSLAQIGQEVGLSPGTVAYWMNKYGLKRRSVGEGVYCRRNPHEPFHITLSPKQEYLKTVGVALYWCEGLQKTNTTVALTNTNPTMLKLWKAFLLSVCGVKEEKLRVHLYVHRNQDGDALKLYWSQTLQIPLEQFEAVSYTKKICSKPNYWGTVRIAVHNVKLLQQMRQWVQELITAFEEGYA